MGLTVAEKEHWKSRIAKRIDHRIETLVAKQDPTFLQRVEQEARHTAYQSLGIDAQRRELEELQKQRDQIEKRERRLRAEQRSVLRGTTVEEELEQTYYRQDGVVENAVNSRARAVESDILGQSELGKQVMALREEKDNLLDTVWLATSTSQIKELWEHANALLGVTPTGLEERALKIPPVQEA